MSSLSSHVIRAGPTAHPHYLQSTQHPSIGTIYTATRDISSRIIWLSTVRVYSSYSMPWNICILLLGTMAERWKGERCVRVFDSIIRYPNISDEFSKEEKSNFPHETWATNAPLSPNKHHGEQFNSMTYTLSTCRWMDVAQRSCGQRLTKFCHFPWGGGGGASGNAWIDKSSARMLLGAQLILTHYEVREHDAYSCEDV